MAIKVPKKQLFTHLHSHTEYSFLDSIVKIKGLGRKLKSKGFHAYAITDHGNINGTYSFYKELQENDIKPILGCEFYYSFDRFRKGLTDEEKEQYLSGLKGEELKERRKEVQKELGINERFHIVALAKNKDGFKKIIRAVELSHVEGFYRFPRIDTEILSDLAGDCIVLTACVGGVPSKLCAESRYNEAESWCSEISKTFGEDFYIEIQPNEMPEQVDTNKNLVRLAGKLGIQLVATNDVHYLEQEDWETHDALLALRDTQYGNPVYVDDPDRFRYTTRSLYLKNTAEMVKSFQTFHSYLNNNVWKQAILNTQVIVDKIEFDVIEKRHGVLPNINTYGKSADERFMDLIKQGWAEKKLNKKLSEEDQIIYKDRIVSEYKTITKLGFSKYFLLVHDLVKWAKKNNIRVGPGRGSVGGSLIAYLIGITSVDSIKWKCPFARMITPDRIDFPDIDIDVPGPDREKIKQYLRDTYGEDQVAGICNFNRMKSKQTLKDVAKVFRVPYVEVDNITKQLISRDPGEDREFCCIEDSLGVSNEFRVFADKYPEVVRHAIKLEGICRQLGMHAAGVVVADNPIRSIVPVQVQRRARSNKVGEYITGWDKRQVEEVGLIKLDILGIDALSYIQRTLDLIKKRYDVDIKLEEFENFDDEEVWEAFRNGHTELVWQLNQPSAVRLLKKLQPEKLEHIIAANALLRPGPLTSGVTEEYIKRRHGNSHVANLHPKLDELLKDTYGMMVFQEDVINIAHDMAGFTWSEADKLRKAIGKKRIDKILELKKMFVDGFEKNGYGAAVGNKVFSQIEEHARYSFNLGHSSSYSILSYWTMYLKIKWPLEFITAALEFEGNDSKRRSIIREGKRLGVQLLPPDINISGGNVVINYDEGTILSGFSGVKGIGPAALEKIIENRPYNTFQDFVLRSEANKTVTSVLLKVGALDKLVKYPKDIEENIETILHVRKLKRQDSYWEKTVLPIMSNCKNTYTREERDKHCFEFLSLPPETHITKQYKNKLKKLKIKEIKDIHELFEVEYSNNYEWFIVSINECKIYEDGDKRTARLIVEDETGQVQVGINQNILDKVGLDNLESGKVLLLAAKSHGFEKLKAGYVQCISNKCDLTFMNEFANKYNSNKPLTHTRGNREVVLYILGIDIFKTKKGDWMASLCVMDKSFNIRSVVIWPSDLRNHNEKFNENGVVRCVINAKKSLDKGVQFALNCNRQRGGGKIEILQGGV